MTSNLGFSPEPISAAAILAISVWMARKGPKQKVASTQIVNELEPLLQQNMQLYLSGPRTAADQAVALQQFDLAWDYLTSSEACGNPELGKPGQNCIADRRRGGPWDWASYYRDPIANDTPTADVAFAGSTLSPGAASVDGMPAGGMNPALLLAAAAVLVAVML